MAAPLTKMSLLSTSLSRAFHGLSLIPKRSFTTTLQTQRTKSLPGHIPPYPYGPNLVYKPSNSGLYGGSTIQFGNKISKGRNKGRTRRSWKPNVRWKKLHSNALGKDLFIKVTRRALRTILKSGGLDNYLLDDRPPRIKEMGIFGWQLRWQIMQSPKIQEKFREQRKKLGLPEPPTFEEWMEEKWQEINTRVEKDINIKDRIMPKPSLNPRLGNPEDASQ